ncbi:aldehyde dehydrogenase family protein [Sphingosinicella sp. YJ22]|uniref:aldehyde dehydrogenase family protein n=1 Tax=Sphingosinicella sp. YJ22 TaxID=1104780 RepID=UPI00140E1E1D|nr:aldehyde dehydrogenase family protein [Sphingosinicella sp. YJ22]
MGVQERIFASDEQAQAAAEIAALVERSRAAQQQIEHASQERVDELIRAMVWSVARPGVAEEIAQLTVDETQLGNYDGKYLKIFRKTRAALMDIIDDKSVGVIEEMPEREIVVIAKPVGVIGALSPSTNPEATPVIKAINAVKGRNSIIIAPHPRAKLTNKAVVDKMREALEKLGAPADLVIAIETPTLDKTNELMRQCDRILATGGNPMVKAAYSSGTPALGVGAGNAVITVDETADLDDAAEKIRISKTLDNAASCSSDNSVVLVDAIHDEMLEKLKAKGGLVLDEEQKAKLQAVLWVDGTLNAKVVAQPAETIAGMAGFDIPEGTKFFIVPETGTGPDHPFSGEKLTVTMTLYRVKDIDEAIALTNRIQAYQGQGHSCGIYSRSDENIMKLADATRTCRVMVNQPQAASNSGNLWNGMRQTFSLGCGSWGGTGTSNNINWRDLINETWVSKPLKTPKELPSDEELFGDVIAKLG